MVFLSDSLVHFKRTLKYLKEYLDINDLEINTKKTEAVIFQKGRHSHASKLPSLLYNNDGIKIVKNYSYLGVLSNWYI